MIDRPKKLSTKKSLANHVYIHCYNEIKNNLLCKLNVDGLPIIKKWYVTKLTTRQLSHSSRLFYEFIIENGKNFLP